MHNHNSNSDMSQAELHKLQGARVQEQDSELAQTRVRLTAESFAKEDHIAATVDWSWATKPVESQGSCGSCYAFTANSVLEGTRAIYEGAGTVEQLSHQLAVDCIGTWGPPYWTDGCDGGTCIGVWDWYKDYGTLPESTYPYVSAGDGLKRACTADLNNLDEGLVTETGYVDADAALLMIMERPLAGAFAVSNLFSFYSYGLIKPGDSNCLDASGQVNHAMVISGLDLEGVGHSVDQTE